MNVSENNWLKNRGYLHLTNQLNTSSNRNRLVSLVKNKRFISTYAFYPLIHGTIKERRYKQHPEKEKGIKSHSYKTEEGTKLNSKKRPLHYATHLDAAIFAYYSNLILKKYDEYLKDRPTLSSSITAYRKIRKDDEEKGKSTINFAHDAFEEIKRRANKEDSVVLKFDIKSFFNEIDHDMLKEQWAEILGMDQLPPDHYNVFKGVTRFSYIMKDDFRMDKRSYSRKSGFDEKKLSQLRKKRIHAFYESPKEFREAIKKKEIRIHKYPFRKNGKPCGFPQGLPISSTLANLYLLKFDEDIINNIVNKYDGYYRRYSDDIIVVINTDHSEEVENYVTTRIEKYKVEISKEKTEKYLFQKHAYNGSERISVTRLNKDGSKDFNVPLTYLGFEFYGHKTLVKSANLAKFYRRLISSVKTKSNRAHRLRKMDPTQPYTIYRNQLFRLYARYPLSAGTLRTKIKRWEQNDLGDYYFKTHQKPAKHSSNYLSYINRASEEMKEPAIIKQIRNHKKILHQALNKHKTKALNRD